MQPKVPSVRRARRTSQSKRQSPALGTCPAMPALTDHRQGEVPRPGLGRISHGPGPRLQGMASAQSRPRAGRSTVCPKATLRRTQSRACQVSNYTKAAPVGPAAPVQGCARAPQGLAASRPCSRHHKAWSCPYPIGISSRPAGSGSRESRGCKAHCRVAPGGTLRQSPAMPALRGSG